MKTSVAALGSSVFFALAPGVVAGVIPYWMTGWEFEPVWPPIQVLGALVTAAAAAVLIHAFARFVREGIGTPAPIAPTQHLVVGGLYRYVRNPMYLAVVSRDRRPGRAVRAAGPAHLRRHDARDLRRVRAGLRGADAQ